MQLKIVTLVIVSTITTLHANNDTLNVLEQQNVLNGSTRTPNQEADVDAATNLNNKCDCNVVNENDKTYNPTRGILTSPNYPNPYPTDCECTWEVSVPEGYSIDVIVEDLDLDGKAGDYLSFRGGEKNDTKEKGPVLTWNIKKEQKFKIHHSNHLFVKFVSKQTDKNHKKKGFRLHYEQYGELTTTEVPTTITTPLPTSAPDGSRADILVNLTGMMPIDFNNSKEKFQVSLANFAEIFSKDIGLELQEHVTSNNVKITLIGYCPRHWPDKGSCTQVRFSLPVVTKPRKTEKSVALIEQNESKPEYQLSTENLEKMWDRFSKEKLKDLNLGVYEVPDDGYYLSIWMGVALGILSLVLLAFLGILYWIWKTSNNKDYSRFGSNSDYPDLRMPGDADLGLDVNSKRPSAMSLYATPHQLVPTLFGDETDSRAPHSQTVYQDLANHDFLYPYQKQLPSYGSSERTSEETRVSSGQIFEPKFHDNAAFETEEQNQTIDQITISTKSEIDQGDQKNGLSSQTRARGIIQNESKI